MMDFRSFEALVSFTSEDLLYIYPSVRRIKLTLSLEQLRNIQITQQLIAVDLFDFAVINIIKPDIFDKTGREIEFDYGVVELRVFRNYIMLRIHDDNNYDAYFESDYIPNKELFGIETQEDEQNKIN
jgi:hypothetical protein